MFERFTQDARHVVVEAQAEARRLRHTHIGTEHLLLGVLAQPGRPAARALTAQGVDLAGARACVARFVAAGEEESTGQIPFTARAKEVLELSLRECLGAQSRHVAAEHILLGLLRQGTGVASQTLAALDVDPDRLRAQVLGSLPSTPGGEAPVAEVRLPQDVARVAPSPEVRRLLLSAAARALDDGRTEIEIGDVREALRRRRDSGSDSDCESEGPPRASTG